MYIKNRSKVLIIPDIHQNISFCKSIFELEKDFDHVIFLGDYFDTFNTIDNKTYFSIENTCNYINSLYEQLKDRSTWLLGNHDLAYIATYTKGFQPPSSSFYSCSGWTRDKAYIFNKCINQSWIENLKILCKIGPFFCVHGGLNINQIQDILNQPVDINNIETKISEVYNKWEQDKSIFMNKPWHWIGNTSEYYGGFNKTSSPIWLNFNEEFKPIPNINQIVGHTEYFNKHHLFKSKNSLNYCIDCRQVKYAIWESIHPNSLSIKSILPISKN